MRKKSIAGAIVGIIGAVFLFIGSALLSLCTGFIDAVSHSGGSLTWMVYVMGFGGAVLGLVGAILDFRNCTIGGILQLLGFVLPLVMCIILGFSVWLIIALILLFVGSILSFTVKKIVE